MSNEKGVLPPNHSHRDAKYTWLWFWLTFSVIVGLAGFAIDQSTRDANAAAEEQQKVIHFRQVFGKTGFCQYCNGWHWSNTLRPTACPICNPRGTLEVPFTHGRIDDGPSARPFEHPD